MVEEKKDNRGKEIPLSTLMAENNITSFLQREEKLLLVLWCSLAFSYHRKQASKCTGKSQYDMRLPARHTVKRRQRGWTLLRETEKCISKHIIKIVMKQSILLITNSCYSFGIFCHYNFCHNTLHVQFLNILKRRNSFYLCCERELTVLVSQWKSKLPVIV